MNHFRAWHLSWASAKFAIYQKSFSGAIPLPLTHKTVANFIGALVVAEKAFRKSRMSDGANRIKTIHAAVTGSPMPYANVLSAQAHHARAEVASQLKKRKFLRVDDDRSEFLDRADLFGPEVAVSFSAAKRDIREAGNCLAAECATAAVFHLMRAAEIALRALAIDRGVSYPNATVESKQVGDLVLALDSKVKELRNTPASAWPSREIMDAQIKFYAEAIQQFRGFNEAWRKHMAHAHEGAIYNRDTALGIMNHVRSLMQILATKISETSRTPEHWTSK